MNSPLISVIIPIYKVEHCLHECVEAVIAQTYQNLEVILVDDGSPDHCGKICDDYAVQDTRIKVIHKKNGGLSDARNAGLDLCTGTYIAFVDGDDVIHPHFIALLFQHIGDADMIFCGYEPFDKRTPVPPLSEDRDVQTFNGQSLLAQITSFKYPLLVVAWNKLYKSTIWENLRYPVGKIHEDEFLAHHIIDKCETIRFYDKKLYYYRQHHNSIMAGVLNEKAINDKLEAFYARKHFFISKNMFNEARAVNDLILYRCVTPVVKKDNKFWKAIDLQTIWTNNQVSFAYRCLLVLKKKIYWLYAIIMHIKDSIKQLHAVGKSAAL